MAGDPSAIHERMEAPGNPLDRIHKLQRRTGRETQADRRCPEVTRRRPDKLIPKTELRDRLKDQRKTRLQGKARPSKIGKRRFEIFRQTFDLNPARSEDPTRVF